VIRAPSSTLVHVCCRTAETPCAAKATDKGAASPLMNGHVMERLGRGGADHQQEAQDGFRGEAHDEDERRERSRSRRKGRWKGSTASDTVGADGMKNQERPA
jgi:hypothetical protein